MSLDEKIGEHLTNVNKTLKDLSIRNHTGYVTMMTYYLKMCEATRMGYFITNGELPNQTSELEIGKKVLEKITECYGRKKNDDD